MNEDTPKPTESNAAPVNPVPPAPGPAAGATTPPPAPAAPAAPAPVAPSPSNATPPPAKPSLRLANKPMGADKPMTNQQIESAVKMPSYARQFSSPMPKIDEAAGETPGWMGALAGLAAVVAVASAILLFLKN